MRLRELKLTNCRQHRELTLTFAPGVNGIIGPNGCGKTNAVSAIEFALTGAWPGWGTKERCLTWGADKGEVELTFEAHGQVGVIRRALHSSNCRLKYGEEDLKKSDAVTAKMAAILGVSPKVLSAYVFTHQSETDRVLLSRPADRAQLFSVLFGTDYCEKIRAQLNGELQLRVPVSLSMDKDTIGSRISETQKRVTDLQAQEAQLTARWRGFDVESARQRTAQAEANAAAVNHPTEGLAATEEALRTLCSQLAANGGRRQQLQVNRQTMNDLLASLEGEIVQHRQAIAQSQQAEQCRRQRQALMQQTTQLQQQLAQRPEPAIEADQDAAMAQQELKVKELEEQVRQLSGFIRGFQQGSCPTCGTTVIITSTGEEINIPGRIQASSNALQQLQPQATAQRQQVDGYRQRRQQSLHAHQVWQTWRQGVDATLAGLQRSLEAIPDLPVPDVAAAQQAIKVYDDGKAQLRSLDSWLSQADQQTLELERRKATLEERRARLAAVVLEDVSLVAAKLKEYDADSRTAASLQGQVLEANRQITELTRRKAELEELEKKTSGLVMYRTMITEAMGVLHRDNYPAAVGRKRFGQLNAGWNRMLALLDQPYTVQIQPDMNIELKFPRGTAYIEEASGGQKMCAATAYLMEVNNRFASQVGFLVLDEPTSGVDEHHVPMIAQLLLEMQKYAAATGLQIIIITHDQRLLSGFSHTIQLEAA